VSSVIEIVYFAAAVIFIIGLKKMSSPVTARDGIVWAGVAMVAATFVTFFSPSVYGHGFFNLLLSLTYRKFVTVDLYQHLIGVRRFRCLALVLFLGAACADKGDCQQ